jgi:hypothetical protein
MAMTSIANDPRVVIVGGFLTEPLFYWRMRSRLLRRGAARVDIVGLHWPDWLAVGFAGFGPSMLRVARTIRQSRRASPTPLIVIGHSAGGLLTRLAMADEPFEGRHAGVAADVGCLVTLGTPHRLYRSFPLWRRHPGVRVTEFLARRSAGPRFAPLTGYLTVGSTRVPASAVMSLRTIWQANVHVMRRLVGQTPGVSGDGIVGDDLARLPGVRHITASDALHGTLGGPWYGNDQIIDQWWPAAIEAWQEALAARSQHSAG